MEPSSSNEKGSSVENVRIDNGVLASEAQLSPRVSTAGTDDASHHKKEQQVYNHENYGKEDYSAPGLDSMHWGGVQSKKEWDQRSIASSMNAEKDDKSIYEEPAVGAVEETEETQQEDDDDEEEPEEIVLTQSELLPDDGEHAANSAQNGTASHEKASSQSQAALAPASLAPSVVDAEGSISVQPASESGDLENVALDGSAATATGAIPVPSRGDISEEGAQMPAGSSAAASPRSLGFPASPMSRASASDFDGMHGSPPVQQQRAKSGTAGASEPYRSSVMRSIVVAGGEEEESANAAGSSDGQGGAGEDRGSSVVSVIGSDSVAPSISESTFAAAAAAPVPTVVAVPEIEETNDGEAAAAWGDAKAQQQAGSKSQSAAFPLSAAEAAAVTAVATGAASADDMQTIPVSASAGELKVEPLEVETNAAGVSSPADGTGPPANAVPPPGALVRVDMGAAWEEAFKGLLYCDGVDSLGRPVVVLNADAVPPRMRQSALTYVKAHLEPLVNSGHYVIVFTARKAKLPSLWIMGAYQALPRPYRKNVQYVVLVRPSGFLRAVLAFMRPFVSRKAGRKIKTIDALEEIGEATGGEVVLTHLGAQFMAADAAAQAAEESAAAAAAGP